MEQGSFFTLLYCLYANENKQMLIIFLIWLGMKQGLFLAVREAAKKSFLNGSARGVEGGSALMALTLGFFSASLRHQKRILIYIY